MYTNTEEVCFSQSGYSIRDVVEIGGIQGPLDVELVIIFDDESGQFSIEAFPRENGGRQYEEMDVKWKNCFPRLSRWKQRSFYDSRLDRGLFTPFSAPVSD